jgi:hypothetical protein
MVNKRGREDDCPWVLVWTLGIELCSFLILRHLLCNVLLFPPMVQLNKTGDFYTNRQCAWNRFNVSIYWCANHFALEKRSKHLPQSPCTGLFFR